MQNKINEQLNNINIPEVELPSHKANLRRALMNLPEKKNKHSFTFFNMKKTLFFATPALSMLLVVAIIMTNYIAPLSATTILQKAKAFSDAEAAMTGKYKHVIATYKSTTDNSEATFEIVNLIGGEYHRYIERGTDNTIVYDMINDKGNFTIYPTQTPTLDNQTTGSANITIYGASGRFVQVDDKYFIGPESIDPVKVGYPLIDSEADAGMSASEVITRLLNNKFNEVSKSVFEASASDNTNTPSEADNGTIATPDDNTVIGFHDGLRVEIEYLGDHYIQMIPVIPASLTIENLEKMPSRSAAEQFITSNGFRKVTKEEADNLRGVSITSNTANELKITEDNMIFALYENIESGATDFGKIFEVLQQSKNLKSKGEGIINDQKVQILELTSSFAGNNYLTELAFNSKTFALMNTREFKMTTNGSYTLTTEYSISLLEYTDTKPSIK